MTEDEIVGWHHRLDGHGFGLTLGVGDGQGGLVCCGSWGHKESDMTEQLNRTRARKAMGKKDLVEFSYIVGGAKQRLFLFTAMWHQYCLPK